MIRSLSQIRNVNLLLAENNSLKDEARRFILEISKKRPRIRGKFVPLNLILKGNLFGSDVLDNLITTFRGENINVVAYLDDNFFDLSDDEVIENIDKLNARELTAIVDVTRVNVTVTKDNYIFNKIERIKRKELIISIRQNYETVVNGIKEAKYKLVDDEWSEEHSKITREKWIKKVGKIISSCHDFSGIVTNDKVKKAEISFVMNMADRFFNFYNRVNVYPLLGLDNHELTIDLNGRIFLPFQSSCIGSCGDAFASLVDTERKCLENYLRTARGACMTCPAYPMCRSGGATVTAPKNASYCADRRVLFSAINDFILDRLNEK